jgi:hypothetical protein
MFPIIGFSKILFRKLTSGGSQFFHFCSGIMSNRHILCRIFIEYITFTRKGEYIVMGSYSKQDFQKYSPIGKGCYPKMPSYPCRPKRECDWPVKPRKKFPVYVCKPVLPPKKHEYCGKQAIWEPSGGAPSDNWDQSSWPKYPHWYAQDDGQDPYYPQSSPWPWEDANQQGSGYGWAEDEEDELQEDWEQQDAAWPLAEEQAPQQAPQPAQGDSDFGAIFSPIMERLRGLGLQVDSADFLGFLRGLSEKEIFAVLGLLGLLGYFVLLGFLSFDGPDARKI